MARVVRYRDREWLRRKAYQRVKAEVMMRFLRRYGLIISFLALIAAYLGF